jgi:hypothetical protein
MFAEHLPRVSITSLWQDLVESGLPEAGPAGAASTLAIHDPCTTRPYPAIQEAVRTILRRLGVDGEELALGRDKTECCGYGGLMLNANPELAREVAARRAGISPYDYLTYCAMCRDRLAAVGKRALHILDLVFPDTAGADPASRRRTGWSERMENRERLRQAMLQTFWGEEGKTVPPYDSVNLIIDSDVREVLETRRILDEDLRRVIHEAEESGTSLVHPRTGHRKACSRPYRATIWVEYHPTPEGYVVHSAYSHRMEVSGGWRS